MEIRFLKRLPVLMAASILFLTGCGDDNGGPTQPSTGSLTVGTTTTGDGVDDSYGISLNDVASGTIDANGTRTFTDLTAGSYAVRLTDVQANCTVAGNNPTTVDVTAGGDATASFEVSCLATAGALEVVTETTGDALDDSYTLNLDGVSAGTIGTNDTVQIPGLSIGDHQIEIGDIAQGCTLAGPASRSVAITGGNTTVETYSIACSSEVGDVRVVSVTTGDDVDADGYEVLVASVVAGTVGVNDTLVVNDLPVGQVEVGLTPETLASNCSVAGANPRPVDVTSGGLSETTFVVSCVTREGSIQVTTSTTGQNIDSGYLLSVDGGAPSPISSNTIVTIPDLTEGDHALVLTGVADNCSILGTDLRTVSVAHAETALEQYDVTCFVPLSNQVVFQNNDDGDSEIYVMDATGSTPFQLTDNTFVDADPAVSPDGSKILFFSTRSGNQDIWVMNADGSNPVNLTANNGGADRDPNWSPTGDRVIFTSKRNGIFNVWVMNADGSAQTALTSSSDPAIFNEHPVFSPDGTKFAFKSNRSGDNEVWSANIDGTSPINLSNSPGNDGEPAWSPDGTKIAFDSLRDPGDGTTDSEIWVMNPDGTGQAPLTNNGFADAGAAWSSDGTLVIFHSDEFGQFDLFTINSADGSNRTRLTSSSGDDLLPDYSP